MVEAGFRKKIERKKLTAFDRVMKLLPKLSPIERAMVHDGRQARQPDRAGAARR
jgi:hypothetical protein